MDNLLMFFVMNYTSVTGAS